MKILHIAVFDNLAISADTSAAQALIRHTDVEDLMGYNYRPRAQAIGFEARDDELIQICKEQKPDLVLFVKCNHMNTRVFKECKKVCSIAYWFPDPLVTFREDPEYMEKAKVSDLVFVDKKNVFDEIKPHNTNTFIIPDGFDASVEQPQDEIAVDIDVSFIGQLYGERATKIQQIKHPISIISNAYGRTHSEAVSRSKINLNFCTSDGPSNRIYKIIAAKGFLLTDDWVDRDKEFEDGKHLVIFKDIDDLNKKIAYYLENEEERNQIREEGYNLSHKYSRDIWAEKLILHYQQLKEQ
jgi:spore maturation protein CgeB